MIGDDLLLDPGTRIALTTIATVEQSDPFYEVVHVGMGPNCTASEFCHCRPVLVVHSRTSGSEVWDHWGE